MATQEVTLAAPSQDATPKAATDQEKTKGKGKKGQRTKKGVQKGKRRPKGKKLSAWVKFTIDCTAPTEDQIMEPASFETFLRDSLKVRGKPGALGDVVKIHRDKAKVIVQVQRPFQKRYLKYLTKKYLKKQQLRDWLRVIAYSRTGYTLKYFNIHDEQGDDDDVDEEGEDTKE